MWKGLSVITNSPIPIVVVLSGSMEPAFQRGDLLFLNNRDILSEPGVGDIVVYNVDGKDIPIVHRIIQKWEGYVCLQYGKVPSTLYLPVIEPARSFSPRVITTTSTTQNYTPRGRIIWSERIS
jgi:signal peptidase